MALSSERNLHEAAKNLFSSMRMLDEGSSTLILAELLPEEGLGRAINDRLRRASAK
ncbi:Sua5 family C-terminal domain-containing protein [Algoriphagus sp.]|uniref:Sua5 family C-terminal domain-containing protein n=1 Tax=Algoriphagus sp. TaxID=1872435 RepID=UPI003919AF4A